jgi:formiminotetrahydrofolate cyclodeaminase
MLSDRTVTQLLDAFSAPEPTPGGGSAAALGAAIGAALLAMVAGLSRTRDGTTQERETLDAARERLLGGRSRLARLADDDTSAYDAVVAAFKLPKSTDEEKSARRAAIQAALEWATTVPLDVMESCVQSLCEGGVVARHGNPSAASDVAVGLELLMAGLRGAYENIAVNVGGLADQAAADEFRARAARLVEQGRSLETVARQARQGKSDA